MKPGQMRLQQLGLLSGVRWVVAVRIVCTVRRVMQGGYDKYRLRELCDGAVLASVVRSPVDFYRVLIIAERLKMCERFETPARRRRAGKDRRV